MHLRHIRLLYLIGSLSCLATGSELLARDLFVDAAKSGGNGTKDAPFATITAALDAAAEGDTIQVAAGVYAERIIALKNKIKFKGGYESSFEEGRDPIKNVTTIDGQGKFRPLQIGDEDTAVEKFQINGFEIARGVADGSESLDGKGGGMLIVNDSSVVVHRCRFSENQASDDGGAIEKNGGGSLRIDRCVFNDNSAADDGGAIRIQGNQSETTIRNCVFANNSGLDKYVVQAKGKTQILNCTFVGNVADSRGIIASRSKVDSTDAVVTVSNCIFAENRALDDDPLLFADDDCAPIEASNCLFYENDAAGGLGNGIEIGANGHRDGDPLFIDAANGDYRLKEASPAIDNAVAIPGIKKDYFGNSRPQGRAADIGAHEYGAKTATTAAGPAPEKS
jgi:predicted outer membrane repeat protein